MRFITDLLYVLAGLVFSPIVIYRMLRHQRYRRGWAQRFGKISRREPNKKCIWLHAVSVGEVNAAKTLVTELESRFTEFEIIISTTTDTGFARANTVFGAKWAVFHFPFDFSWTVARALRRLKPTICLLMELEVWPNFVRTTHRRGIPVVVVNGRISDKSFPKYRKIRRLTRTFFGKLDLVLAQTAEYADRFRQLGCPADRIVVTNSLKYDTAQIASHVEGADALATQLGLTDSRLWVAGGTGNDEERIILEVYRALLRDERLADVRLVVVPRKPERFDEVARLIEQTDFPLVRFSQLKGTSHRVPAGSRTVILGDTMGDLRKFYSLATVIFVGRSLVPMGGSDMMEAAALGKCTLFGPHAFNFRQTVDVLLDGKGALCVHDGDELLTALRKCLFEQQYAEAIAQRGQQIIKDNQGATARMVTHIAAILVHGNSTAPAPPG
jgi:3-deoxy-D-manno-octulosonic-acid transferase